MTSFARLVPQKRDGSDPFRNGDRAAGFALADFWQWSTSDLVANTVRGLLAEFIVARAVDAVDLVRDSWAAFDLTSRTGVKIEVKSASYLQTWHQTGPSVISFSVKKARAWDANTNEFAIEQRRHADVYVFALLAHLDKATLDPLNLAQWEFYVVPTHVLDSRKRSQHSISLASLRKLESGPYGFDALANAVEQAKSRAPSG